MTIWGPGTGQKSKNKKESNPDSWRPGKFSYDGVLEKQNEYLLSATKIKGGKLTTDKDIIAQSKGFSSNAELEAFKNSKPELYEAMGGINYIPKAAPITDAYKTHLSEVAVNKIEKRFKNNCASEINDIVETLNSNKWQSADTMKKYSDTANACVNDYIALNEIGYFGNISEEDKNNNLNFFKDLKEAVNNSKDVFAEYKDEKSYAEALRKFDLYNKIMNSDLDTVRGEVDKWQNELNRLDKNDKWVKNSEGQKVIPNTATEISEFVGKTSKEIKKMISEREEILQWAENEVKITNLTDYAQSAPDFKKVINYEICNSEDKLLKKYDEDKDFYGTNIELLVDYICTDSEKVRNSITLNREISARMVLQAADNRFINKSYYDWAEQGYDQLTDKEKEIVKYYAKTDTNKLQEYLDLNELEWKSRGAKETADSASDVAILKAYYAVTGARDRILQSFGGFANAIVGEEKYVEPSKTQLTSQYVRQNLEGFEGFAYDVIDTFTYMTPSLLMNAALPGSGFAVTGITAAGGAYNDGINMGMSASQARIYGTLVGAAEACLEKVFSGVAGMTGKVTKTSVEKVVAGINSGIIKFVANLGINAFSEGFEEFSQEVLEPLFENIALGYQKNDWDDIDWDAAVYSGLLGMFMGAVTNMAPTAVDLVYDSVDAKLNYAYSKESLHALVNNGLVMPKGSDAYSRAVKANAKIESGKNLSGTAIYNLATAIRSDMVAQSEARMIELGTDENTAKELSPLVTKAVLGDQFTVSELESIVSNETAIQVAKEMISDRGSKVWSKVVEDSRVESNAILENNKSYSEEHYENEQIKSDAIGEQFTDEETQGNIESTQKSNAEIYADNQENTIKLDDGYEQVKAGLGEGIAVKADISFDENTSNAVTNPLESYSAQKQSMIKSYLNSVDENLKSFVERVQRGTSKFERVYISDVTLREVSDIKNLLGIDTDGYTHNINTSSVRHILKRHGIDGNHDKSMSNVNDIARMTWVLENYDNVEVVAENELTSLSTGFVNNNNKPAVQIRYSKKINGTYYLVEAAFENNYKKLWVQSAYLKKSESVTQAHTASDNDLPYGHARSALTSPLSNGSILQNKANVNNQDYNKKSESVTRAPDASKKTPEVTSETEHASPLSSSSILQNKANVNSQNYNKKSESVTRAPDASKKTPEVTSETEHASPLSSSSILQNKTNVNKASDISDSVDENRYSIFESDRDTSKAMSDDEKAKAKEFVNVLGLDIKFEDLRDMEDRQGNKISPDGYLDRENGIIHLNLYAKNPTEFVLKHELTHFAEKVAEQYAEFSDSVCESRAFESWIKEKTGEEYLWDAEDKYKQYILGADKSINPHDGVKISREIVADFAADMLFTDNGSGLPALAVSLETKPRNIIVQYVLDFISWLKSKFSSKERINRELALLEDGYRKLINEAVQSTDENLFDGEMDTNSANEYAFSVQQNNPDISFCFVHCDDEELMRKAEEMESQGKSRAAIENELGVMRGVFGDWVHILNIDNFRLYHYGTKKLEKSAEKLNLKKVGGGIDCLLSDIIKWPEFFEYFPKYKKFKVSIRESAYSYDTARIMYFDGERRLVINSKTLESHLTQKSSTIKIDILRELQRLIQIKEGKYVGRTLDYWKDLEQKKKLPYSDVLKRRLTAKDMMKYFIDNYEAELATQRQYAKEIHQFVDRKPGNGSDSFLYDLKIDPAHIYTETDDGQIVSLEKLSGKETSRKHKKASEINQIENDSSVKKSENIIERDFIEKGKATAKIKDFAKSKEKSEKQKQNIENNNEIRGGNSGFLEKGIFDVGNTVSEKIRHHIEEVSNVDIAESDAIGRPINTDIQTMMKGSFAVNKSGQPISAYIISNSIDAEFKKPQLGVALGTIDMAFAEFAEKSNESSLSKAKVLENYVIAENPLCLQWEPYELSVGEIGFQLVEKGYILENEYFELIDEEMSQGNGTHKNSALQTLKKLIKELGFDSIVYENSTTDHGSMAIVVLNSKQLIPVSENGVIISNSGVSAELHETGDYAKRISNAETNNEVLRWALDDENHIRNKRRNRPDARMTVGNSGYLEQVGSDTEKAYKEIVRNINETADVEMAKTDIAGRELARSIIKETENSIFKNEKGELVSFFIWEKANISDNTKLVKKGTQFLNFDNAFNWYAENKSVSPRTRNGNFREFYLNAVSPLVIRQSGWNTAKIAEELSKNGVIDEKYHQKLLNMKSINNPTHDNAAATNLKNKIELLGYDSIIFIKEDGSVGVTVFNESQIIPVSNNGMLIEGNGITYHNKVVNDSTHGDDIEYGVTIKPDGDYIIDIQKLIDEVHTATDNKSKMQILTDYLTPSRIKSVLADNNTNIGYSACFESGEFNIWHSHAIYNQLISEKARETALSRYDTGNRYIDGETWQKLAGTVLKTESGNPIPLFLRNKYGDNVFKHSPIGPRLSTLTAAHDEYFAEKENHPYIGTGSYDEYFANIQNPYFMRGIPKEFTAREFAELLHKDGVIGKSDYKRIVNLKYADSTNHNGEAGIALKKIVKGKGFDSIIYINETLDPGSMGVLVLDESRLIPVSRNGIIINNDIKVAADSDDGSVFLMVENGGEENVEISRENLIDNTKDEAYNKISKIKCENEKLEGGEHLKTGVPFVKKVVEIYGEMKEVVVPKFEVLVEMLLPEELLMAGRNTQKRKCYSMLKERLKSDPELRKCFTQDQLRQLEQTGEIKGYTWHHAAEVGKMQLVDTEIHGKTGHTGGYSIWSEGSIKK